MIEFFSIPEKCPICGDKTEIKKENETKILYCSNSACSGKLINKLDYFCGKKGLDIKGLSKATLEKLINWGWVSKISDIFTLSDYKKEWISKPGFGKKSVENILEAIEKSKNCTLNAFISSLGINLIGSTVSKDLIKVFSTWEEFIDAVESKYHFWELPNFGPEMHQAIIKFDYSEAKEIYDKYLNIAPIDKKIEDNSLNGISIVITGKINKFKNRDELKSIIESKGGKVVNSISGKTNYLINNDINSASSKNLSAKKLGVTILSEEKFIEMFL